jgi:hypothetical protein
MRHNTIHDAWSGFLGTVLVHAMLHGHRINLLAPGRN